jgi:hypothetical protein
VPPYHRVCTPIGVMPRRRVTATDLSLPGWTSAKTSRTPDANAPSIATRDASVA